MMQFTQEHLTQLRSIVLRSQHHSNEIRVPATNELSAAERQGGFPLLMLKLIEITNAPAPEDRSIRQMSSILFKNYIKRNWAPSEDGGKENATISEADRALVKDNVVTLMCMVPPEVQRQLSEVVGVISQSDFPAKWENLLPELVSKFNSQDFHVINGVLLTANSIFRRFRYVFRSDEIYRELKYCLDNFQEPLLRLFTLTWTGVETATAAGTATKQALAGPLEALRLMARIFFSLNWQDLPEYFEDHMGEWMALFTKTLNYSNPLLVDADEEDEADPITRLQAAVVQTLLLYADKYEEEFKDLLPGFTQTVWNLLMRVSQQPKYDGLAFAAIGFLASVVKKAMHIDLFKEETALRTIVQSIVIPNLHLRESDEELFEDNPVEYIRRDIEGSDSDTRRRGAADLVKGLCRHFEAQVTGICMQYVQGMLQEYSADPANKWKSKDAAITLVLALTVKGQTEAAGVSSVNAAVSISDFFTAHILPELQSGRDERPVLKADAIKFVTTFRNQMGAESTPVMFPLLVTLLSSESGVVRTYAANAVERFLSMKDKLPPAPGHTHGRAVPRLGREQLTPFLQPLLEGLFNVLEKEETNSYVMKTAMRVVVTADAAVTPMTGPVLTKLTQQLGKVAANQSDPQFTHYLFETLAALIRAVCGGSAAAGAGTPTAGGAAAGGGATGPMASAAAVEEFERALFPPFQTVLGMEVAELTPYVFQILAMLLELRPSAGVSAGYASLFTPLLTPALWESKGNVPALSRLLRAYLRKGGEGLMASNPTALPGVLGVFQKLVSSKVNEGHGLALLETVVAALPAPLLAQYMGQVFSLLLMRLQTHKTTRYVRLLLHFFAHVLVVQARSGAAAAAGSSLVERLEAIQPGLFGMILEQVWLPNVVPPQAWGDREDKHAQAVGLAHLVALPALAQNPPLWKQAVAALVSVLLGEQSANSQDDEDDEAEGVQAYDSAYCRLHHATVPGALSGGDVVLTATDPKQMLAATLRQPGAVAMLQGIPDATLASLRSIVAPLGVSL